MSSIEARTMMVVTTEQAEAHRATLACLREALVVALAAASHQGASEWDRDAISRLVDGVKAAERAYGKGVCPHPRAPEEE